MRWRRYSLSGALLKDRKRRLTRFESRYRILALGDSFEPSLYNRAQPRASEAPVKIMHGRVISALSRTLLAPIVQELKSRRIFGDARW